MLKLVGAVLLLGLVAWGAPEARAGAFVRADASVGSDSSYSAGNLDAAAAGPLVHATAGADDVTGGASWGIGGLPCPACITKLSPPHSASRAEADGSRGSLRASAFAATSLSHVADAQAAGIAMLTDTITFIDPTDARIGIHLDVTHISTDLDRFHGSSSAVLEFGAVVAGNTFPIYRLALHGVPIGNDRSFEFHWTPFVGSPDILSTSPSIGSEYGREIDVSDWLDTLGTDSLDFYAYLRTDVYCDGSVDCYASANAGNTGYMIIPNATSAEGYSYLGPQPAAAVPEPASGLLLLSGLAVHLAQRRRRR